MQMIARVLESSDLTINARPFFNFRVSDENWENFEVAAQNHLCKSSLYLVFKIFLFTSIGC